MQVRTRRYLFGVLIAAAAGVVLPGQAIAADAATAVGSVLWQPSMNVFRRFSADREAMFEFYGDVLGFEQLNTLNVGGGTGVARFQAGGSELKLTGRVGNRSYESGGPADATGVRLLTFFFPDEAALTARFVAHGLAAPEFAGRGEPGRRSALVADPDGQPVELVVIPGAPAATYQDIEIGLTVSDLAASRRFYREFVGLTELAPVYDELFATTKYSYRHGTTIVSLRSFGAVLPISMPSGGLSMTPFCVGPVTHLTPFSPVWQMNGHGMKMVHH
jgi:catechol 2,3-dioxygenase-like lactoylglutathione lyase family enzyme